MPWHAELYTDRNTGQQCGYIQLKGKDGKYGPPILGKRAQLSTRSFSQCEVEGCKQKVRFQLRECVHVFCGYCLKETDAEVNFEKHEPQKAYACPVCVCRGGSSYSHSITWVEKNDVYKFLIEKNICICCFQIKTFDVSSCKHNMCCLCLKRMLRDDDVREYICKIDGCHVKYDLSDILEMYEKSISDTSLKIFAYPGSNCSMTGCSKLTLLKLIKCNHSLCWECITKGSTAENREIERQLSMKCPVRNCGTSFPLDCLKYYVQCLMSSMQLATTYIELRFEGALSECCRCVQTTNELLVKLRNCVHKICLSCFENYIVDVKNRRQSMHLDLSMTMTKCFHSSCKKEVPTACLRAISMAIKGEPIAVVMYLQFPKGKGKCSLCDQEEVYIELAICKHGACKSCVMKMYNKSKNGFVKCEYWLCDQRVPEVCLKRVFNDQLLLKIDTNYFDEISKKDDITRKVQINPDDSLDVGSSKALDGQHETDHMETERVIDLLCPSYGERLSCSYCSRMAVIKFSECRHGWCLRCLKFLTKTQKDDKMHCKYCTSCGSIGNVRRFIRNCETDGLLVPSYLKPISGTTSCYLCRKREAILEGTECGHRFCDSCLNLSTRLQMMTSKCPALGCESVEYYQANEKKGKQIAIQPSKCVCCSKMEAADLMTECGHASCKNCIQSIFPCPIKTCKSFIDSATSEFLSKHIISNKGMLFIGKQVKTRDVCCMCSGDQKASKSEEVVQIRRCNHLICTNCLTKLKEKCKGTGISTCPSDGCLELFFIPQMAPSQLQTEDYIGSEENSNPAAILYEKATSSGGAMKVIGKVKSYLFPSLKVDDYRVKQNGLPNLGLSCYKNSVLQVLAETPNFFSMLRSMNTQSKENWTFTLSEILWRVLKESSSKQDIEDWLLRFQVEFASIDNSFVEYTQHDSLSFLTSILSGITDEALRREKEGLDKVIDPTDIFRGTMHDQYTCCNCKKKEHHGESTFFSLPLPTVKTDNPKIGECLYQFFDSEIIKDVFPCSHCKHHTVQKEIQIKKYPDVLVLQLGMIYENMDYFERVQRTPKFWETFAGLSNNIHLGKINKEEFSKYKLYGVIVHSGGLTGGHYYTYVKKMNDENWERRDDSYVRQVKLKEVLLSEAYILFYHKIEKASPV